MVRNVRSYTMLAAVSVFLLVCFVLYSSLENSSVRKKEFYEHGKEVDRLETKLKLLEKDLEKNEKLIKEIRGSIGQVVNGAGVPLPIISNADIIQQNRQVASGGNKVQVVHQFLDKVKPAAFSSADVGADVCALAKAQTQATGDVQMLDIYEMLPFDNPDGGVWKQGWDITYDSKKIQTEPKLEVVVIPHSHDDPGWIKTFEKYYQDQTRHILDGMVKKLGSEPQMKFIYAEISFFERWWRDTDQSSRDTVKKILSNGQLEIVTGAWVMTDEANSHYFATIDQMLEGHQWLKNHLDYRPSSHWSIDPFGLSPSIAYILKKSNLTNMAIQRVHYVIKRHLAKNKQLEFQWRQLWSGDSASSDISTHLFPFYSYDVPHTCGPDPKICCQFDFKRLPSGGISCPWNVPPQAIDDGNVAERARTLADQYRKKAQLYKANTLLIPLGDDFRYDTPFEWDMQFENYKKLFEQMNSQSELNIHARFGTLADYFKLLHEREPNLPVLSGDFFTYADRDDHYWSGYFTSRPFYKRMDRVLQHYLRSAEIAYTLSVSKGKEGYPSDALYQLLVKARRNLALFQHHDGVTGTAKDLVVADYGQRMLDSIHACEKVLAASAEFLLKNGKSVAEGHLMFKSEDHRSAHDAYPKRMIVKADASTVVVFNPLGQKRHEVTCVVVDSSDAQVLRQDVAVANQQIAPYIDIGQANLAVQSDKFELCFETVVDALSFERYEIATASTNKAHRAQIRSSFVVSASGFESSAMNQDDFEMSNEFITAKVDGKTGLLKTVTLKDAKEIGVDLSFVKYGARGHKPGFRGGGDSLSGAYLFLPDGQAKPLSTDENRFVLIDGPLVKKLFVQSSLVMHHVKLDITDRYLSISNAVDITKEGNVELAMRFKSAVKSSDISFTDLNGLQMIKRRRLEKLTLQGNYYPMPSAAYIEDEQTRISLLSAQPAGVASLQAGWLEVMLDRRLMQDDDRGLFQGVTDNKMTPNHFKFVVEPMTGPMADSSAKIGYHTLNAHYASLAVLYPNVLLIASGKNSDLAWSVESLTKSLPCDVHLVNLRTLAAPTDYASNPDKVPQRDQHALILHRFVVDCRSSTPANIPCETTGGKLDIRKLLKRDLVKVEETSLTLMYDKEGRVDDVVSLEPMDLRTFKLAFK